jgi:hypothetical protein
LDSTAFFRRSISLLGGICGTVSSLETGTDPNTAEVLPYFIEAIEYWGLVAIIFATGVQMPSSQAPTDSKGAFYKAEAASLSFSSTALSQSRLFFRYQHISFVQSWRCRFRLLKSRLEILDFRQRMSAYIDQVLDAQIGVDQVISRRFTSGSSITDISDRIALCILRRAYGG